MAECIFVNLKETGQRVILPLNKINSILELENGECFIETGLDSDGCAVGLYVNETFEEIMSILSQKILVN